MKKLISLKKFEVVIYSYESTEEWNIESNKMEENGWRIRDNYYDENKGEYIQGFSREIKE